MSIFLGLLGIIIGFLLTWKANWIVENFGRINWAESHISAEGGTRLLWKLIGIGLIIFSMLFMFGFVGAIINAIFSPLFRGSK